MLLNFSLGDPQEPIEILLRDQFHAIELDNAYDMLYQHSSKPIQKPKIELFSKKFMNYHWDKKYFTLYCITIVRFGGLDSNKIGLLDNS